MPIRAVHCYDTRGGLVSRKVLPGGSVQNIVCKFICNQQNIGYCMPFRELEAWQQWETQQNSMLFHVCSILFSTIKYSYTIEIKYKQHLKRLVPRTITYERMKAKPVSH